MTTEPLKSQTLWQSAKRPKFRKVTKSAAFDIVVIGGGITGLTTAYLLKKAGKKVCLIERNRLGFMDTGLTTAHLTCVTDERLSKLVQHFGRESAALVWQAGARAIDQIESHVGDLNIDCDFRRASGYLLESLQGNDESETLQQDAQLALDLGFAAEFMSATPYFNRPGVRFANQAKFHPLKYLAALADAVEGDGSKIYEQSEVSEVQADPLRVIVGKREIAAEYLVIATHVPLMGTTGFVNATLFQTKLYPYSSYVIGAKSPKGLLPEALFWDTTDPYYYLRVESGKTKDYLIFGGEDHKTGQEPDTATRFLRLRERLAAIIPQATPDRQWSGQVVETNDGLPYIGATAENQFVATGFGGNGMTFGTLAAVMTRDAVLKNSNQWQDLFSVNRKHLRGGTWDYVKENADFPAIYLNDSLTQVEASSPDDIAVGEGKIILHDGKKIACSRDSDGALCAVSAVCTHMGCLVRWNGAEQTWDCPCHGSRFKTNGEVLAGPAESALAVVPLKEPHTAAT